MKEKKKKKKERKKMNNTTQEERGKERKKKISAEQMLTLKNVKFDQPETMEREVEPGARTGRYQTTEKIIRYNDYIDYIDFLTVPEDKRLCKTIEEWKELKHVSPETLRRWEDSDNFLRDYWDRLRRNLAKYINFSSVLVKYQDTKDYLTIARDIVSPAKEPAAAQVIQIENMTVNQINKMLVNLERYTED